VSWEGKIGRLVIFLGVPSRAWLLLGLLHSKSGIQGNSAQAGSRMPLLQLLCFRSRPSSRLLPSLSQLLFRKGCNNGRNSQARRARTAVTRPSLAERVLQTRKGRERGPRQSHLQAAAPCAGRGLREPCGLPNQEPSR